MRREQQTWVLGKDTACEYAGTGRFSWVGKDGREIFDAPGPEVNVIGQ